MKNLESIIQETEGKFQEILNYVKGEAQSQQIHEVERSLFADLLQLGLLFLQAFLACKGDGNIGKTHTDKEGVIRQLHPTKKEKTYFSIFGKVVIERAYYWLKGVGGLCPLDEELNLPSDSYSYLLIEWATLLGVREAYNKVTIKYLSGFCIILDLFHVLEYLWKAAYVYYAEGSDEAEAWVRTRLRMLLQGKVTWLIRTLKYDYEHKNLSPSKRSALKKVITYLENEI